MYQGQIQIAQGGSGQTVQAPKRMQPGGQVENFSLLKISYFLCFREVA